MFAAPNLRCLKKSLVLATYFDTNNHDAHQKTVLPKHFIAARSATANKYPDLAGQI